MSETFTITDCQECRKPAEKLLSYSEYNKNIPSSYYEGGRVILSSIPTFHPSRLLCYSCYKSAVQKEINRKK